MFAVATPIAALAWCSSAAWAWMSGRCATSAEGTLTGSSSGNVKSDSFSAAALRRQLAGQRRQRVLGRRLLLPAPAA